MEYEKIFEILSEGQIFPWCNHDTQNFPVWRRLLCFIRFTDFELSSNFSHIFFKLLQIFLKFLKLLSNIFSNSFKIYLPLSLDFFHIFQKCPHWFSVLLSQVFIFLASPRKRDHLVRDLKPLYNVKLKNRCKLWKLELLAFLVEGTMENNVLKKVDANSCALRRYHAVLPVTQWWKKGPPGQAIK